MIDRTDQLIEAVVACREIGMVAEDVHGIVCDVYAAPWTDSEVKKFRRVVGRVFDAPRKREAVA